MLSAIVAHRGQSTPSPLLTHPSLDKVKAAYATDPLFYQSSFTSNLSFFDGLWFKDNQVVVPLPLRKAFISDFHDPPEAGHPGIHKTLHLLQRSFWWPQMRADVAAYVTSCHSCQRSKASNVLPAGPLQPVVTPSIPWHTVSMDFIVALPLTPEGYDSICVFVDKFTKMVHLAPTVTTVTSVDVAHLLYNTVIKLHGWPVALITDRDPKFMSEVFQSCLTHCQVQHCPTTAYHPQSDGQTERMNRVLTDMLRHYVNPTRNDWHSFLPAAEFAINNSWQESIKETPFFMNYGKHPVAPMSLVKAPESKAPAAVYYLVHLQQAHQRAKQCLVAAQQRQKAYYDKHHSDVTYELGQQVLLSTKNFHWSLGSSKLWPKFIGPFTVTKAVGSVAYELDLPPHMKIHNVFHVALLKPYKSDGRYQPPPPPVIIDGEAEYEVSELLSHRTRRRGKSSRLEFLVHWKGYGHEHNTWEPQSNLTHCPEVLQSYWHKVATTQ